MRLNKFKYWKKSVEFSKCPVEMHWNNKSKLFLRYINDGKSDMTKKIKSIFTEEDSSGTTQFELGDNHHYLISKVSDFECLRNIKLLRGEKINVIGRTIMIQGCPHRRKKYHELIVNELKVRPLLYKF